MIHIWGIPWLKVEPTQISIMYYYIKIKIKKESSSVLKSYFKNHKLEWGPSLIVCILGCIDLFIVNHLITCFVVLDEADVNLRTSFVIWSSFDHNFDYKCQNCTYNLNLKIFFSATSWSPSYSKLIPFSRLKSIIFSFILLFLIIFCYSWLF